MDGLRAARAIHPAADVVACNWMALRAPGCRHVVSSHPSFFEKLGAVTAARHLALDPSNHEDYGPSLPGVHIWRGLKAGSTGLAAARIARRIGYFPVLLCGVPIDDAPYLAGYCPTHPDWRFGGDAGADIARYRQAWLQVEATGELDGVLSMSGWTAELLGRP